MTKEEKAAYWREHNQRKKNESPTEADKGREQLQKLLAECAELTDKYEDFALDSRELWEKAMKFRDKLQNRKYEYYSLKLKLGATDFPDVPLLNCWPY